MTNKQTCDGLDCAWCGALDCPREKKEIIIDGVDVSGCIYLPYCEDKQGNCGNNPNCYFKQLKRKEQECKDLKEEIICLKKQGGILLADKNAFQIGYDTSMARVKELEEKLKIAEEALNNAYRFDCDTCKKLKFKCNGSCDSKFDKIIEQALQKMKEVSND